MLLSVVSIRGQSLEDKLNAVKYFISGQGLSFVILKATTSELIGPKKKHLNYLTSITHEPNVSIPNMVKYLMQRARHQEWSVVFKSLMTIHYLISYGNEKFIQNLASSIAYQKTFDHLASFSDRSSNQAYDMSTFIRRYARYLSAKICSYKSLGIDFCRSPKAAINANNNSTTFTKTTTNATTTSNGLIITTTSHQQEPPPTIINNVDYICKQQKSSSSSSPLKMKTMQSEQLLSTLPILQNLFDLLMAFDACVKDLNNGIINSVFSMLYKDFVKLYIAYQTAIIRLLELFSRCKQSKQAHEMLEAYKKFLVRMDKVSDFMFVVDSVGMDKSDMPNVSRSPNVSLKILERHLENLTTYSSLRRLNSVNNQSTGQTTQSVNLLSRGQSVDLPPPKIDYDYGTYGRRRSLRRQTTANNSTSMKTSTPTKAIDSTGQEKSLNNSDNNKSKLYQDFSRHYYTTIEDPLGEEEDVDLIGNSGGQAVKNYDVISKGNIDKITNNEDNDNNNTTNNNNNNNSEAMKAFDQQSLLLLMGDSQDLNETTAYESIIGNSSSYNNRTIDFDNNNSSNDQKQEENDKNENQKSSDGILNGTEKSNSSSFLVASRPVDWVRVDL